MRKEKKQDVDNEFWYGGMKKGKCVETNGEDKVHLFGPKLEYQQPHT